jgi:hypothetical protein
MFIVPFFFLASHCTGQPMVLALTLRIRDYCSSLVLVRYTTFTRSVIGKAGATINTIKEASGARVKVSSNQEFFPGTNERIILVSSVAWS